MAKRFRDSGRWVGWYRALPWRAKILWEYMTDHADTAGVWVPDWALANFQTNAPPGQEFAEPDLELVRDGVTILPGGRVFLKPFITDNYVTLQMEKNRKTGCMQKSKVWRGVEKCLKAHGLRGESIDTLLIPYIEGMHTSQEQEQEHDQEQDLKNSQEEGGPGETKQDGSAEAPAAPAGGVLVQLWQNHSGDLPKILGTNPARMQAIREALSWQKDPGWWEALFKRAAQSVYLTGKMPGKTWRADFDFVINPKNATRIAEGFFDGDPGGGKSGRRGIDWSNVFCEGSP